MPTRERGHSFLGLRGDGGWAARWSSRRCPSRSCHLVIKDPPTSQGRTGASSCWCFICILVLLSAGSQEGGGHRPDAPRGARSWGRSCATRRSSPWRRWPCSAACPTRGLSASSRLIARGELHVVFRAREGPTPSPHAPRNGPSRSGCQPSPGKPPPVPRHRMAGRCRHPAAPSTAVSCNAPHELTGARVGDRVRCPIATTPSRPSPPGRTDARRASPR